MHQVTLGRVVTLAAIALIVAAGLCLFDSDHGSGGDLCVPFSVTNGLFILIFLMLAGRVSPTFALAYSRYRPDLPAPPPKA